MTLRARVEKLEGVALGKNPLGRIIGVDGGGASSEADVRAFLATKGVSVEERDLIVFRAIMAPGPSGPVGTDDPLRISHLGGKRHDDFVLSGALDDNAVMWGDDTVPLGDLP